MQSACSTFERSLPFLIVNVSFLPQDLALKFFEACNTIAAASLENSTWFRRNVAVLPQSSNNGDAMEPSITDVTYKDSEILPSQNSTMQTRNAQYSTQAICLMAEVILSYSLLSFCVSTLILLKVRNFFIFNLHITILMNHIDLHHKLRFVLRTQFYRYCSLK